MKIPGRIETILKFKEKGGKVAAVTPYHYPKALLRAFNILPVELWGPPKQNTMASKGHLQTYVCSVVHSILNYYLTDGLKSVDYVLVPHTCDSLQGLGSLFIDFFNNVNIRFLTFYLPRGRRSADLEFTAKEIEKLYKELASLTGKSPDFEELFLHIENEEKAVSVLKKLLRNRRQYNVNDYAFYKFLRTKEYLSAEDFVKFAEEFENKFKTEKPLNETGIVLSGLVPEPMEIFRLINQNNAVVSGDDLSITGRRLYPKGEGNSPFVRMAKSLVFSPPDSMRGDSVEFRLQRLLSLAKKGNAKGVIFFIVKFCEPEYFYLPFLRKELKEKGIESIVLDTDINENLSQQTITRIEVFLETLT